MRSSLPTRGASLTWRRGSALLTFEFSATSWLDRKPRQSSILPLLCANWETTPDRIITCSPGAATCPRSEEHTSELQSQSNLVCRLLLEKKKNNYKRSNNDYVE